jgi:hypothetical protein
VSFK